MKTTRKRWQKKMHTSGADNASTHLRNLRNRVLEDVKRPKSRNVVVKCRIRMLARITREGRYPDTALQYSSVSVEEVEKYGSEKNNGEERSYSQMLGWSVLGHSASIDAQEMRNEF